MNREIRTFASVEIESRDDSGTPGVSLQVIKPGVVDDYGSVWKAGAFDASLESRLPVLCWGHDWTNPLGPGVGFRTGRNGPIVDFNFSNFDAVPEARRAHAQVKDGTIGDCSVGFSGTERRDPTDEERSKYPGVREVITKANLDEVSLVLRGAVPGAKVLAVRSARMSNGATVDMDAVLELARLNADGALTDAEADNAMRLLAVGEPSGVSTESGSVEDAGEEPDPLDNAMLDADIDATLQAFA